MNEGGFTVGIVKGMRCLGRGGEGKGSWLFWAGGLLTWFRVRLCRVEPLKGSGRVVLDENHCVARFVAGGDLNASRFG